MVMREDDFEELTFDQRAEWMSHTVKWEKYVLGKMMYKCKCIKMEDS